MKINNFYITKSTYSRYFYIEISINDFEDKYATVFLELGKITNYDFMESRLNRENIVTVINKKTLTYVT
jgi:hypothetical protein